MANELTDAETSKLFNETSKALRDNDATKLDELMEAPVEPEKSATEEVPEEKEDKESKEKEESGEENEPESPPEEKEEKESPPEKADKSVEEKKEDKKEESPEVKELREQLAKVAKENHDLKSQAGRVPSMQRRLREIDKKLEELTKKESSPSSQPSAKIKPKVTDLLKGVSETDPDLAKAIADAISEAVDGVAAESAAKEKETLTFFRDQNAQEYADVELNKLLQEVPNAPDIFKDKHWTAWKAEQTAGWRGLAESDTAADVVSALYKYATDMSAKYPELAKKDEAKKAEPPASGADPEAAERARRLEEERLRKKQTAANVGSPGAAGKTSIPDDPDTLFKYFSDKIRKERTG